MRYRDTPSANLLQLLLVSHHLVVALSSTCSSCLAQQFLSSRLLGRPLWASVVSR